MNRLNAPERTIPNTRHAVRDRDAYEVRAVEKRVPPNARDAIWNNNRLDTSTFHSGDGFSIFTEGQFCFFLCFCFGFCRLCFGFCFCLCFGFCLHFSGDLRPDFLFTDDLATVGQVPLFHIFIREVARDRDACEVLAVQKCALPNARHAVRDRDACEVLAARKRAVSNTRYAVRDRDACEVLAEGKRAIPNARDAVRDRDACEVLAAQKCPLSNARHAVRDRDACEVLAAQKCALPNARHAIANRHARELGAARKRAIPNARNAVRDRNACEGGAAGKRVIPNTCHAVRDRDACEVLAEGKCVSPNTCHIGRDRIATGKVFRGTDQSLVLFVDQAPIRQGFKCGTVSDLFYSAESIFTDFCNAVRDRDALEGGAALKRKPSNACYTVRDRIISGKTGRGIEQFFLFVVDQYTTSVHREDRIFG